MLRAIIVDDEKAQRFTLQRKLEAAFSGTVTIIGEAFSVDTAIFAIRNLEPDIVFLDIDLIGGTGFDVLDAFPALTFEVVFVTSYPEFGARAFRYQAIDYILKPIDPDELREAVKRVLNARPRTKVTPAELTTSFLSARLRDGGVLAMPVQSIVYCEAFSGYVKVALEDGSSYYLLNTLTECAESLAEVGGVEIERGTLINCTYCTGWEPSGRGAVAIMANGVRLNVSKRMKPVFISIMSQRLGT
ncbi:MAG: response regulator [Ignavibacteria bacterium]|nr:response regulator [Ignavibacteria bacterium]